MRYIKTFEGWTVKEVNKPAYSNWEIGDTLICVDNKGENYVSLTIGKKYIILDIRYDVDNVKVLNDENKEQFYYYSRFKSELDLDAKKYNI